MNPRMSGDDRREQILGAVLPVVLERGITVTSKQLAEAAGVAEGTLFKAFGSKEGLLRALLRCETYRPDEVALWLSAGGGKGLSIEQLVREIVDRTVADYSARVQLFLSLGSLAAPPTADEMATWMQALSPWVDAFQAHQHVLTVTPEQAADALRNLCWAGAQQGEWGVGLAAENVAHMFLYGVAKPDSASISQSS